MQLGIYSFGEMTPDPKTGRTIGARERLRRLVEEIELADRLGLDVFGVGEHHRAEFVVSTPAVVLAAAATRTTRLRLTSAVSVLSSDDPVRVFQDFAALGLPLALAIIGGEPRRFVPLIQLYREAARRSGHDPATLAVSINSHGLIEDDSRQAAEDAFAAYSYVMAKIGRERGWAPLTRQQFEAERAPRGATERDRRAASRHRARHDAHRHGRDVRRGRRGDGRRRGDRGTARRRLRREQALPATRDEKGPGRGVRAKPATAGHGPHRPLPAPLAR